MIELECGIIRRPLFLRAKELNYTRTLSLFFLLGFSSASASLNTSPLLFQPCVFLLIFFVDLLASKRVYNSYKSFFESDTFTRRFQHLIRRPFHRFAAINGDTAMIHKHRCAQSLVEFPAQAGKWRRCSRLDSLGAIIITSLLGT